ncbi:MAG TPA: clostripain-related cysteine peptidase [Pyrinomonadaceae bacterium]|nr:clostripain-related cysteine peptidase [Pyrinomonadaceae bacterium]
MFYINGDNDLEEFARNSFNELGSIGSTSVVNLVAQYDGRLNLDTRRIHIAKGDTFRRDMGESACSGGDCEKDMADPDSLIDFVRWAQEQFPARHYALFVWDHASGFRFLQAHLSAFAKTAGAKPEHALGECDSEVGGPFKSVMADTHPPHTMLNGDFVNALCKVLTERLDVLGFDACLMQMAETNYAMERIASVMVASEDNVPARSWSYSWIRDLSLIPEMAPEDLGRRIVAAYKRKYYGTAGDNEGTHALSAVRLDKMPLLATAIDSFSASLLKRSASEEGIVEIREARKGCPIYGGLPESGGFQNIDLGLFAERMESSTIVGSSALNVGRAVEQMVIARYADLEAGQERFGSLGTAVYFPRSFTLFEGDPLHEAYDARRVVEAPVGFVYDHYWSEFLSVYLRREAHVELQTGDRKKPVAYRCALP